MLKKKTPEKLRQLIRNFQINRDKYRNTAYKETELRVEFLNPFLRLFGWDVDNQAGLERDSKDVLHEKYIEEQKRRVDYVFKVGNLEKFILEAKRPSIDVENDKKAAFQTRRYGHESPNMAIAILSDFEQFSIYECKTKPNENDAAETSRLFYCEFHEYPRYFHFLYAFISKESVMTGLHDKIVSDFHGIIANVKNDRFVHGQFNLLHSIFENVTEKQLISVAQDSEIQPAWRDDSDGLSDSETKAGKRLSVIDEERDSLGPSSNLLQTHPKPQDSRVENIYSMLTELSSQVTGEISKIRQRMDVQEQRQLSGATGSDGRQNTSEANAHSQNRGYVPAPDFFISPLFSSEKVH